MNVHGTNPHAQSRPTVRYDDSEPIAVIGLSLRFPGEAVSAEAFYDVIVNGRRTMTEFPSDRLNKQAFYDPDNAQKLNITCEGGNFLRGNIAAFDAPFFSITPSEAACMDPQQRGLLQTAYHALENAGQPLSKCSGSMTAVYTGSFTDDYRSLLAHDSEQDKRYAATGVSASMLANRISWCFDFHSASVDLDTACSSSLTTVHLACQGLKTGESTMALAGGCNLIFHPNLWSALGDMSFLSPSSRSHSFDRRADGYARGEGFGMVVLKRLSTALRDGDTIRAVIRATGVNQDGRTPGIAQPSGHAQQKLIEDTYRRANLDMRLTRYFEAHGTGTATGDPIEANAIMKTFAKYRSDESPLYVGAVKANVGHLEGASGIAGLIKAVLVLEHGAIPPIAGLEEINENIDTNGKSIVVNSFGFGGTNAHVVIDDSLHFLETAGLRGLHRPTEASPRRIDLSLVNGQVKDLLPTTSVEKRKTQSLLVWSSADESGVERLANAYEKYFEHNKGMLCAKERFEDLIWTLNARRSHLMWRSYAIANTAEDLRATMATGLSKPIRSGDPQQLAFIFTGQGAQYAQMGLSLLNYPIFYDSLAKSQAILKDIGYELGKGAEVSNIDDPEYSQTITTTVQIALVDLLRSLKVLPAAVVGHSSGEIAAALSRDPSAAGAMLSVGLNEPQALQYIGRLHHQYGEIQAQIACFNSPKNVTLTGDPSHIDSLKSWLDHDGVFARKLNVNVAYHSAYMNRIAATYRSLLHDLEPGNTQASRSTTMVSSVTASIVTKADLRKADYWVKNMVSPVRFSHALSKICAPTSRKRKWKQLGPSGEVNVLVADVLELGPHSALRAYVRDVTLEHAPSRGIRYLPTLVRQAADRSQLLDTLGQLFCKGYDLDLLAANNIPNKPRELITNLPEYPFNPQTHWLESRISAEYRFRKHPRHDFLGTTVADWNPLQAQWRNTIRAHENPWIRDHKVNNECIFPGSGMLVMAIEAVRQMSETDDQPITGYHLKDIQFLSALAIVDATEGVETNFTLRTSGRSAEKNQAWSTFTLFAFKNGEWTDCCRGRIKPEFASNKRARLHANEDLAWRRGDVGLQAVCDAECSGSCQKQELYDALRDSGVKYGPSFQAIEQLRFSENGKACGRLLPRQWAQSQAAERVSSHVIHPATLDGLFQLVFTATSQGGRNGVPTKVPTYVKDIWISSRGLSEPDAHNVRVFAASKRVGYRGTQSVINAIDAETNTPKLAIEGLEMTFVTSSTSSAIVSTEERHLCGKIESRPDLDLLPVIEIQALCEGERTTQPSTIKFYEELSLCIRFFLSDALSWLQSNHATLTEPHFKRYAEWMSRALNHMGSSAFPISQAGWQKLQECSSHREDLISRVQEHSAEGRLMVHVGRNLVRVLSGEVDPLDIIFEDKLANQYYHEKNSDPQGFAPVARWLESISHKDPSLKILEVGSGTGGTTGPVLEALTSTREGSETVKFGQYDFTDISPAFLEPARKAFGDFGGRMQFKCLDLEKSSQSQGFDECCYDLIIASNVLHATKEYKKSLRDIRWLLKPGGKLLLIESTETDLVRVGFVFGLLKGWWTPVEDVNTWSPCKSQATWHADLQLTGFSGIDCAWNDHNSEACHEATAMVATAVANEHVEQSATPSCVIIVDSTCAAQIELATLLSNNWAASMTAACTVCSLQEAVESLPAWGEDTIVISLLEVSHPFLSTLNESQFYHVKEICSNARNILWVTRGTEAGSTQPEFSVVKGFSRSIRSEKTGTKFVVLALESMSKGDDRSARDHISNVTKQMMEQSVDLLEPEYEERGGILHIPRVVPSKQTNQMVATKIAPHRRMTQTLAQSPPMQLHVRSPGILQSLEWAEDDTTQLDRLASDEVLIKVKAIGVNFRDCLIAIGQLNDSDLGSECAGVIVAAGSDARLSVDDRVCVAAIGTYRTMIRCKAAAVAKVPESMSLTEAASLPTAFLTVIQAFKKVARLQPGEKILIHSGAGGTGQVAINVAQRLGAEVFASVGSEHKAQLLKERFRLDDDHIVYSRDASFAQGIKRATDGRGVDVVLNSLSGDGLAASWDCIAPFGRFIEIGKKDIMSHSDLQMSNFAKNVTFAAVDLAGIVRERPEWLPGLFEETMSLLGSGHVKPARPLHVFQANEVEDALRFMQSGKNSGKAVIELSDECVVTTVVNAKPSYMFSTDATYVIAGGLGGLGRSAARWMAERGARHLILLSRSGTSNESSRAFVEDLKSQGVHVEAPACDVANLQRLQQVITELSSTMPPIKGCIQGTMVLRDTIFDNMTYADWSQSTTPKIRGSWNLHTVLPRNLHFFVLLSSIGGILGASSQANYAAGNTYKDALAHHRVSQGLKATSLDLGMMAAEGVVAESEKLQNLLRRAGFFMEIAQAELFALLDEYCNPARGVDAAENAQVVVGIETPGTIREKGIPLPRWMNRPLFRHYHQVDGSRSATEQINSEDVNYAAMLAEADTLQDAAAKVSTMLLKKTARVLGLQPEDMDAAQPMYRYGIDSLVAVELRNWFESSLGAEVAVFEMLGNASIESVCRTAVKKSRFCKDAWKEES
ncbi:MAG: hypothetical protein Q9159_006883 [Coniocarpon cinnabarinum]